MFVLLLTYIFFDVIIQFVMLVAGDVIMKFIDNIKKETVIICNNSDKKKLLMRNKLINLKIMNMNEFISKFCFDYDENTIIYVMNKYNAKKK